MHASIITSACSQLTPVERRGAPDTGPVTATIAAEPSRLQQSIAKAFAGHKEAIPKKWRRFSVARPRDESFPRDDQIQNDRGGKAALSRYLAMPLAAKRDDLFLYDFSDADAAASYWESEYASRDRPAPFRCNFLIHLAPSGAAATTVEVFELSPRVWVGKKFSFEAHGPGMHLDIRPVAPTTADRVELMQLLQQLAAK